MPTGTNVVFKLSPNGPEAIPASFLTGVNLAVIAYGVTGEPQEVEFTVTDIRDGIVIELMTMWEQQHEAPTKCVPQEKENAEGWEVNPAVSEQPYPHDSVQWDQTEQQSSREQSK